MQGSDELEDPLDEALSGDLADDDISGDARASEPSALPPTVIAELDDGAAPLASEPTRTLAMPETVRTDPVEQTPRPVEHALPSPEPTMRLSAERGARPKALEIAARVVVGSAIVLGIGVVAAHLASDRGPAAPGPLRVVADAPLAAAAAPRATEALRAVDPTTRIDTLEREAADHLASGRLAEASRVYATLAERAPHQHAYAIAARVLAERASR